ncbi:hypothetical protein L3054_10805 [Corynebacterium sp. MC-10]|nr:hypothetical protein [Corynebacterium parakroppenstedtii]
MRRMSPAPPGGGAAGSKASAAVVRKERVCWADRGEGPVPAASTESENPSRRSRTAPPHDGARRTRDARAAFGFAPHTVCEGRKATVCTRQCLGSGYAAQETDFGRA